MCDSKEVARLKRAVHYSSPEVLDKEMKVEPRSAVSKEEALEEMRRSSKYMREQAATAAETDNTGHCVPPKKPASK